MKTLKNLAFLTEEKYGQVHQLINLLESDKIPLAPQRTIRAFLQMIFGRHQIPKQNHEDFGMKITQELLLEMTTAETTQNSGRYLGLSARKTYNALSSR